MCTMESEQFFLKWNNFENNLTSGFADLLQQEAMVDVTLAAGGKIVQAHKIILSICSSYFRNMFQINPCQHPIVVLKDVGYQELSDMLDFMYKGEANVRQEDLPSFLKLAETLKVKGLAGNQAEVLPDNYFSSKYTHSQISTVTKDCFLSEKELPSSEFMNKDTLLRKKRKRPLSPLVSTNSKVITNSQNIKLKIKYDSNFVENENMNSSQSLIKKEDIISDNNVGLDVDNHVTHETIGVEKDAGPSITDDNCEIVPQVTWNSTEYSFKESCFGGFLLTIGGHLFRRKSTTLEKSYWFCCKLKCRAKGILHCDGNFQLTNFQHNHEPDFQGIKKKEILSKLKKLALQSNSSGRELLKALGINEDIKKYLNFIRTTRSRQKRKEKKILL